MLIFIFKTAKGTSLHGTASFDVFCVKISLGSERKNQKTNILGVIFHPYGEKKPWSDFDEILHWGDIWDISTDANFGGDRLRRFFAWRGVKF